MNYYYDIYVSMDDTLNSFYEMKEMEHIKKIPIIRVNKKTMIDMITNSFVINKTLLNKVHNKTELYGKNVINTIEYMILFTSGIDSIVVEFHQNGKSIYKSNLTIEEELNINDIVNNLKTCKIDYQLLERDYYHNKYLLEENSIKKVLTNELNNMKYNNDIDKLKYYYYNYFKEINEDMNIMYNRFIKEIKDNFNIELFNLYKIMYKT